MAYERINNMQQAIADYSGWEDWTATMTVTSISPVPIPGALWLLGSGLIGLIGIRRFRK